MDNLKIDKKIVGDNNQILIIKVIGEMDSFSIRKFEKEIRDQIAQDFKNILLDLEDLKFMSSSGIGVIIRLLDDLEGKDGSLNTLKAPKSILRSIEIIGISSLIKNFTSEESAVEFLSK